MHIMSGAPVESVRSIAGGFGGNSGSGVSGRDRGLQQLNKRMKRIHSPPPLLPFCAWQHSLPQIVTILRPKRSTLLCRTTTTTAPHNCDRIRALTRPQQDGAGPATESPHVCSSGQAPGCQQAAWVRRLSNRNHVIAVE